MAKRQKSQREEEKCCTIIVTEIPVSDAQHSIDLIFKDYKSKITSTKFQFSNERQERFTSVFITFKDHSTAQEALTNCIYTKVNNNPIKIRWEYQQEFIPEARVFVSGLSEDIFEYQLHEAFSDVGPVLSCSILRNSLGNSTGNANVQFADVESSKRAIDKFNGAKIGDKIITVESFKPSNERDDIEVLLPPTSVSVSGPDWILDADKLRAAFDNKTTDLYIFRDDTPLAIVVFSSRETADNFVNKPPSSLSGRVSRRVKRKYCFEALRAFESHKVFITGLLGDSTNTESLEKHLQQVGELSFVNASRSSYGIVVNAQYKSSEGRTRCLLELNHTTFGDIQFLPISISPYIEQRLERSLGTIFILPEVPASSTTHDIQKQYGKEGLIGIALSPNTECRPCCYLLFDNTDVTIDSPNVICIRNIVIREFLVGFYHSFESETSALSIYGFPKSMTYEDIFNELKDLGSFSEISMQCFGDFYRVIIRFHRPENVKVLVETELSKGRTIDLLNQKIAGRVSRYISKHGLPEYKDRAVFLTSISSHLSVSDIRELISSKYPVDGCYINYLPNGIRQNHCVVIFKDKSSARDFCNSKLVSELGYDAQASLYIQPRFPSTAGRHRDNGFTIPKDQSASSFLSEKTREKFSELKTGSNSSEKIPDDVQSKILESIDNLSIDTIYDILRNEGALEDWIASFIH